MTRFNKRRWLNAIRDEDLHMHRRICFFCGLRNPLGTHYEYMSWSSHHIDGNRKNNDSANIAWSHVKCHQRYNRYVGKACRSLGLIMLDPVRHFIEDCIVESMKPSKQVKR